MSNGQFWLNFFEGLGPITLDKNGRATIFSGFLPEVIVYGNIKNGKWKTRNILFPYTQQSNSGNSNINDWGILSMQTGQRESAIDQENTGFNSRFWRKTIKDSYSINFGGSGNFVSSVGQGSIGINWLTRGKDASFWPYITYSSGGQFNAFAVDASVNASIGSASYNGSVSGIDSKMFLGYTFTAGISGAAELGGKIAVGGSHGWGMGDYGQTLVNYNNTQLSLGVGVGTPIQLNGSMTNTYSSTRLDNMIISVIRNAMWGPGMFW